MEKGFTLVEILAALVVFSLIIMVAVPIVSSVIESSKERAYTAQIENIKLAAKNWGSEYLEYMPKKDEAITIFLYNLKKKVYLKNRLKVKIKKNLSMRTVL